MRKLITSLYFLVLFGVVGTSAQVTFTAVDANVNCGTDPICIDIEVSNFDSVLNLQFAMRWDPTQLDFTSATDFFPNDPIPKEDSIAVGLFWFGWGSTNFLSGLSLSDDTPIWTLCFDPIGTGPSSLEFEAVPIAPFVFQVGGYQNFPNIVELPFATNAGMASVNDSAPPTLDCPTDQTLYSTVPLAVPNLLPMNVADNCGVDTTFYTLSGATMGTGANDASNEIFQLDSTAVTYTVIDDAGNMETCDFDVMVLDTTTATVPGPLEFIPVVNYDCDNNTLQIDVIVTNFDTISSFAHAVRWDTSQLDLISATSGTTLNVNTIPFDDSTVYVTWNFLVNPFFTSAPDNTVLYSLTFTPNGTPASPFINFEDLNPFQAILVFTENNVPLVQGVDYTFEDEVLNLIDNSDPTFPNGCPTDIEQPTDLGKCSAFVDLPAAMAIDACSPIDSITYTIDGTATLFPSNATAVMEGFLTGVHVVTYTAYDGAGNTGTCTFNVTVNDNEDPTVTCPVIINGTTDTDLCIGTITLEVPQWTDNCGVDSITYNIGTTIKSFPAGLTTSVMEEFPIGTTNVTYTVYDPSGRTDSCPFNVVITDDQDPTITCPSNIDLNANASCQASVNLAVPANGDNCGVDFISYTIDGTVTQLPDLVNPIDMDFPLGTTNVIYTVTDDNGLTGTCNFNVVVTDNEVPTITCPGNITTAPTSGCISTVSLAVPANGDNCGVAMVSYTIGGTVTPFPDLVNPVDVDFSLGTTNVIYTVTDDAGLTTTCDFNVIVTDPNTLNVDCPGDISVNSDMGVSTAVVATGLDATVTGNCLGAPTLTYQIGAGAAMSGDANGETFNSGVNMVTYTVTDSDNNTSTCSFNVTVNNNLAIECISNQSFDVDAGVCSSAQSFTGMTITDGVGNIASTDWILSGATTSMGSSDLVDANFNVGVTTVTFNVIDNDAQEASCSFTVTVTDNEDPTISNTPLDVFPTDLGECQAFVDIDLSPISNDNCGIDSITYMISGGLGSGLGTVPNMTFPLGQSTITYTAYDESGNTAMSTLVVEVGDSELPEVTCPSNIAVTVLPGTTDTMMVVDVPVATDNCGIDQLSVAVGAGSGTIVPSGTTGLNLTFPIGVNTVTGTAVDDNGNMFDCTFTVTVTEMTVGPTDLIDCPGNVVSCDNIVNNIDPIFLVDETSITNFVVTIVCPDGTFTPANTASGFTFRPGVCTVTYTATNGVDNDECSFTVSVDDEEPVISDCPDPTMVAYVPDNSCMASVTWTEPTATDNCGVETFSSSHNSPSDFNLGGPFNVSYIAIDSAGNQATCVFEITVLDTIAPLAIGCPTAVTATDLSSGCGGIGNWTAPTGTDNCSTVDVSGTHESGDTFYVSTVVAYTFTDQAGNISTCNFTVTVNNMDMAAPEILGCPNDTTLYAPPNACEIAYSWIAPTAVDACDTAFLTSTNMPGDIFNVRENDDPHIITYFATDPLGNMNSCSFNVIVLDTIKPVINCPAPVLAFANDPAICGVIVDTWNLPTATDVCDDMVQVTCSHAPGDFFNVGTTLVTCTAMDNSANTIQCFFTITVEDMVAPSIECPANDNIVVNLDGTGGGDFILNLTPNATCDSVQVLYEEPTVTDNCPDFTVATFGPANNQMVAIGETNNYKYLVTDDSGLQDSCEFTILVMPLDGISINASTDLCSNQNIVLSVDSISGALYSWETPNGTVSGATLSLTNAAAGTYTVTCTLNGCTAMASETIVEGPSFAPSSDGGFCDSDLLLFLNEDSFVDNVLWTFPDGTTTSTETNPVVEDPQSGVYTVTATTGACTITRTLEVAIDGDDIPDVELASVCTSSICLGESCELIGTPVPGAVYNWSSVDGCAGTLTGDNTISVTPTSAGVCQITYWVSIGDCTSNMATVDITVLGLPEATNDIVGITPETTDITFNVLDNDNIDQNGAFAVSLLSQPTNGNLTNNGDGTFVYEPATSFVSIDQFVYQVCYSCQGEIQCANAIVTIETDDLSCTIPTVISPNNDNVNDLLIIGCLENEENVNNELIIYNQWGDEVFRRSPYGNGVYWDGTHDDKPLPDGTYFYVFKKDKNVDEIDRGYITIFR